jgi:hypothetical protein
MNMTMKFKPEHFALQALTTLLLLGTALFAYAKGPLPDSPPSGWRPIPCEEVQVCGNTTTYSSCDYWNGIAESPESGARQFLATFAPALHLEEAKLRTMEIKSGLTSRNVRFQQIYKKRRVFRAEVKVTSDMDGRIRKVITSYFPIERVLGSKEQIVNAEAAEAVGRAAIGDPDPVETLPEPGGLRQPTRSELVWFPVAGTNVVLLVWEMMIQGQRPFLGDYLSLVDANSGVLMYQENWIAMSTMGK